LLQAGVIVKVCMEDMDIRTIAQFSYHLSLGGSLIAD
jgi:hypothetical protein